jgi:hypothetical protein
MEKTGFVHIARYCEKYVITPAQVFLGIIQNPSFYNKGIL